MADPAFLARSVSVPTSITSTTVSVDRTTIPRFIERVGPASLDDVNKVVGLIKQRSGDYHAEQAKLRLLYEGKQQASVREAIQQRYANTHQYMTPVAMNVVNETADLDAQVYRRAPTRSVVDDNKTPLEGEAQATLTAAVELAGLDSVMLEVEKRNMAARAAFLYLKWDDVGESLRGTRKILAQPFWPSDVYVVTNPALPAALWASHVVILRLAGGDYDGQVAYLVWTRRGTMWTYEHVTSSPGAGQVIYDGKRLPVVAVFDGLPDTVVHDVDRDLATVQNAINVGLTNYQFLIDMQAHAERYVTGYNDAKGQKIVGGPGTFLSFPGTNVTVGTLQYSLSDIALRYVEKLLRMLGLSRRQPPEAFSTEPGPPLSGISRIVQNIPADQKRTERQEIYRAFEAQELLPVVVEVARIWGRIPSLEGARFDARFQQPPVYEEPLSRTTRCKANQDAGWWSPARAAVEAGAYVDRAEAIAATLSDELPQAKVEQNAALFSSLSTILIEVGKGTVSRDAGIAMVGFAYPTVTPEDAARIVDAQVALAASRPAQDPDPPGDPGINSDPPFADQPA